MQHPHAIGLVGIALLMGAGTAFADAQDTLNLTVGMTMMHDDNLFRLSSDANTQALLGTSQRSDTIRATTVGLKFAKDYSLQRFEFETNVVDYRYQTFDYLDFTATNYAGAWRWALTPRLRGNFTRNRTEALNSFTDYHNYRQQNIRTTTNTRFDADYDLGAAVHLIGGVAQNEYKNSKIFLAEGDSTLDTAEFGVRYVFRSGASLSLVGRKGNGDYTNRHQPIPLGLYDNGFEQDETELRAVWPITAKTRIEGRIGHLDRQQEHYAARNYDGTVGNLSLDWEVTAKTRITAAASREFTSYETLYSSYIETDRIVIAPVWQMSAKTALRLRYDYARRDYLGAIAVTSVNGRSDITRLGSLSVEWAPLSNVLLSAAVQSDRRTSNRPSFDYDSTMGTLSAQINF